MTETYLPAHPIPTVEGEGPLNCKLAIVGEAPGEKEMEAGRPFVGASGQQLDKMLLDAGLLRRDIYITNVIKVRPDGNDIKPFINLEKREPYVSEEAKEHIENLARELSQCSANCILGLGATALFVLTGKKGITKWRGSILESTLLPGRKVICTYHPRNLLGRNSVYLWRYDMAYDIARAKHQAEFPEIRPVPMRLLTAPSLREVLDHLDRCNKSNVVDVDIEVLNGQVSCIAFCVGIDAMSIPFIDDKGNYFNLEDEALVWRAITKVLENPNVIKRGQNFLFDVSFLLSRHGIRTVNCQDTMIAQGVLFPELRKGLDYICSAYTEIPYYKDDGKQWNRITNLWPQHWEYNAKDTIATSYAHPVLVKLLQQQGNYETYLRQERLIGPCSFMMQRGVRVDIQGFELAKEAIEQELEALTIEVYRDVGVEINLNSPKQLMDYFYTTLGFSAYKSLKTGMPTINGLALKRLVRKGNKTARTILRIRKLAKLSSTYFSITLDSDKRMRCFLNPIGTKFGRMSSSKTIFKTGANLQNQPEAMRQFLLYDEGYVGYNLDLSQGENRVVAFVGPVPEMMAAFEQGKDVHALTGALLSGLTPDEVIAQHKAGIKAPLGTGEKTWRDWGKSTNHGLNYGLGPDNFSLLYELPVAEGRMLHAKYHASYPGVRNGYHAQIRAMLSANRTVVNPFGRKILFLDRWGEELFKDAYDSLAQSTVADIVDERGLNYIYYNQTDFGPLELLLQVHDSIVFQIPKAIPWSEHARMLLQIKNSLEQEIVWKTRRFVIPVDFQISRSNMSKGKDGGLKDIPRSAFTTVQNLAEVLENLYNTAGE